MVSTGKDRGEDTPARQPPGRLHGEGGCLTVRTRGMPAGCSQGQAVRGPGGWGWGSQSRGGWQVYQQDDANLSVGGRGTQKDVLGTC